MNYLGMTGLPLEPMPCFPDSEPFVLLTASAACDRAIVEKLKTYVAAGNTAVVTSGFLKACEAKGIREMTSLSFTGRKAAGREYWADVFQAGPPAAYEGAEPIRADVLQYKTNATWCDLAFVSEYSNFPLLTRDFYGKGQLLVLTIPDDFSDLYRIPGTVNKLIHQVFSAKLPVYLDMQPRCNLFLYDNDTFGVLSYHNSPSGYAKDGTATGQIGTATVTVTTTNYKDFRLTLVLNAVDRITPVADGSITASKITYGQTLSESRISGTMKDPTTGAAVEGTFSWQQPDDTILDASTLGHDIGWKFTPKDGNAYTEATGIATVKVDKAQQYGKVSMKFYIYGETPSTPSLTDRTGDAKAQVTYYYNTTNSNSGGTEWKNIQPDTLSAGTRYYMYAELGETENYESFTTDCVKFWVMKAIPTCTKPTGLTAKYGQKLSQIALPNPEGNTPGTWRWQEPETVLDQLGTRSFYADFKPDNETYSEVLNVAIDVTVGPADGGSLKTVELAQKYTDASVHTYKPDWSGLPGGQTWRYNSEYSVSTGSNVTLTKQDFAADGSLLTYAISGGKAGDKITLTLKASCDNYKDFTITLNITLTEKDDQKPLTITGNTSVIYGEKLTLTTSGGNGTGAVTYRIDTANSTGEAAIDPNTGVLTPVRIGSVSVIAAKAGDNDYNDVTSAPFVLMIKPATPTGEPNYTKITTGGKTLRDAALTTKGSTLNPNDGKLEWLDDKGNALPDDTRVKANMTYKWRFTPTDTNYTTLTGEIELLYHKSNGGGSSGYSYYTIEATAGAGGSISPSGSVSVREGGDQTFTITPDKGYAVSNVKIDGKSIGAVKSYTFANVSKTHTIEVIFVKGTASARTGDGSDLPLWSALLLASTLTLAGAVHYKRKRAR